MASIPNIYPLPSKNPQKPAATSTQVAAPSSTVQQGLSSASRILSNPPLDDKVISKISSLYNNSTSPAIQSTGANKLSPQNQNKEPPNSNIKTDNSTRNILIILFILVLLIICVAIYPTRFSKNSAFPTTPTQNLLHIIIPTITLTINPSPIPSFTLPNKTTPLPITLPANPVFTGYLLGNLKIREQPSDSSIVKGWLYVGTYLYFDGRSQDNLWLHITDDNPTLIPGWVIAKWVELKFEILSLPIIEP